MKSFAKLSSLLSFMMFASVYAGEGTDLIGHMGTMQHMAHKAGLAIDSRNLPLASFYVHEIEEVIEQLDAVESYDGYPIASQVRSIFVPSFENLERAVKSGDWDAASSRFDKLLASCNICHQATDHAYIRIQRTTANPFMQSFDTQE